jgi:hypothetical protein
MIELRPRGDPELEKRRIRRLALTASAAWLAFALPQSARADDWWNSVLGFIGWGPNKTVDQGIDYSARPALVVPPKMDLPPPQAALPKPSDWPNDPDAAARRAAEADSRRPAPPSPVADAIDNDDTANTADQSDSQAAQKPAASQASKNLDWIGSRSAGLSGAGTSIFSGSSGALSMPNFDITNLSTWNPFSAHDDTKEVRTLKVGVEPPREYLTQPPPGYRSPVAVDTDSDTSQDASAPGSAAASVSAAPAATGK